MLVSELRENVVVVHGNAELHSFDDDVARRVLGLFGDRLDAFGEGIGWPVA